MSERRLVFLHGFTQTHHHWHRCAGQIDRTLGDDPTLVFVDLPGHGLSSADRLSIEQAAPELVTLAGTGTYIGYSMGARHALAAACAGAPEIERLVVIGGTAGLADPGARQIRVADDESKARRLEAIGVKAFVEEWLAEPMFAGLAVTVDDRRHRLRNTVDGLAASLRLAGTGAQSPLWDVLASIEIPVLVLAGAMDAKFTELGRRMAGAIPAATFASIPNAGHAAHAEAPEATASLVADWLLAQPSARPTASSAP
jgi:2-succinyl-6-hydroxy-2,4-cyclohexadiene-1-carboxylate synthase